MSIKERAKAELDRVSFGEEDTKAMMAILDIFFEAWDSGGAVSVASAVLRRLIAGKPLSPLTGEGNEWVQVDTDTYQNVRCGTVFKTISTDIAYDIDTPGRPAIVFQYWPEEDRVPVPIIEIET